MLVFYLGEGKSLRIYCKDLLNKDCGLCSYWLKNNSGIKLFWVWWSWIRLDKYKWNYFK